MHYYNFPLVSALNTNGVDAVMLSTPETALSPLRPSNVPVRGVFRGIYKNQPKWWRGLLYAVALVRIGWWCLRERPDIVHFHFFQVPALDYLLLRSLNLLGVKTITTVHDVLPFELGNDLSSANGRKMYQRLYSSSSGLILHSIHALRALQQLDSFLALKTVLIPHGNYSKVHSEMTQYILPAETAKYRLGLDISTETILVFGTIKKNKRLDLVLEAVAEVTHRRPNIKLLIVGEPQDRDVVKDIDLAEKLDIASRVIWRLERVTDEELALYFSMADMMIFPYEWIFQSGALIMAMNFAKPVIATAVDGNEEIVANKITGMLVPVDDVTGMARAIEYILDDPDRASAMGKAASEYVTKELSWDKIAQNTLDYYRRILSLKRFL